MRADAAASDAASPPWQVSAVQRTLNQAGYGPIKVSGILDDSTREGIARFERDHNLPITGQNTLRVRHALSAATGRLLD
jgi:peptidoglycan hydrolase-like protein with peptidoglycan-binding domain